MIILTQKYNVELVHCAPSLSSSLRPTHADRSAAHAAISPDPERFRTKTKCSRRYYTRPFCNFVSIHSAPLLSRSSNSLSVSKKFSSLFDHGSIESAAVLVYPGPSCTPTFSYQILIILHYRYSLIEPLEFFM